MWKHETNSSLNVLVLFHPYMRIYIYIYIYIYAHTYIYIYTHTHKHMHIHTYTYTMYIYTHINTHTHTHTHIYIYIHIYIHTYVLRRLWPWKIVWKWFQVLAVELIIDNRFATVTNSIVKSLKYQTITDWSGAIGMITCS